MQSIHRFFVLLGLCSVVTNWTVAGEPKVLLEVGRDYPETRLFSACVLRDRNGDRPQLAVAGFSQTGHGDVSDLAIYAITDTSAILHARLMQRGNGKSSIRTLRAADLNGDGVDELVALGRAGDEDVDSTGELQVLSFADDRLQVVASTRWQSGRYTHGYGMDVADLDGDGRQEIVTGGFFKGNDHEQAEIRVWRLEAAEIKLVASKSWGVKTGDTRVNSVCLGDVTGDGRSEIVIGGRTGQIRTTDDVTSAESDQITVWTLRDKQIESLARYEGDPQSRSRFREVRLVDIDGRPGLEILAAGRSERGGKGNGRGQGGGGGRGSGGGNGQPGAFRPLLHAFRVEGDRLATIAEASWGDVTGEVRDVAVAPGSPHLRIATILADNLKPQRQAQMTIWKSDGKSFHAIETRKASFGAETRSRQIVSWPTSNEYRLLTVGFVKRDDQVLGQIIAWDGSENSRPRAPSEGK